MKEPERPDWVCGCPNDHAMTRDRAWCGACSEWCYENALCVRGENEQLRAENARLLSDPGRNTAGKATRQSQESRLAALRVLPKTGTKRMAVLQALARVHPRGLADEQIHRIVGGDIRSINARRKELEEGGWVVKSLDHWLAPSGNHVSVWVLSLSALEAFGWR